MLLSDAKNQKEQVDVVLPLKTRRPAAITELITDA